MVVHRVQQTSQAEIARVFTFNGPLDPETWRDIREANPRCRVRLKEVGEQGNVAEAQPVIVYEDGSIWADRKLVELDFYEGPEHEAIRNEGRDNVEEDS